MGRRARAIADRALATGALGVSAVTFWEIALLYERRRVKLDREPSAWRRAVLDAGIEEVPLTGDLAVEAAALTAHADPADRFIIATALRDGATLVTADAEILAWRGALKRHDARR